MILWKKYIFAFKIKKAKATLNHFDQNCNSVVVSNYFCYLFVKFRDFWIYHPFCTLLNSLMMTIKTLCVHLVSCILYLWTSISFFIFWSHRVGNWTDQQCNLLSLKEEQWYSLETLHYDFEAKINLWDLSFCIIILRA
jgi:hypothetical protein